ncbi:unnamed protein product [Spodoptera exigua]|nr:unnamed protein product [Spodoptera exigua]
MRSDVLAPSELEGTDYLLSSTMRLEDSFLQILDFWLENGQVSGRVFKTSVEEPELQYEWIGSTSNTTASQKTGCKHTTAIVDVQNPNPQKAAGLAGVIHIIGYHQASGIKGRSPATVSTGLRSASKGSSPPDQNQARAYGA